MKNISRNLKSYDSLVFDCDGVILDSNQVKTRAFYKLFIPWGREITNEMISYHKKNGGISRFEKIRYFFKEVLKEPTDESRIQDLSKQYGVFVREELFSAAVTPGCEDFLKSLPKALPKYVVSGGLEDEVIEVLDKKGLAQYFNSIRGSPLNKIEILTQIQEKNPLGKGLLFGDSNTDYIAAKSFDLDFVFLSEFSSFEQWREFCKEKDLFFTKNFKTFQQYVSL